MRTTIDSVGRVVVPKALRDNLGLTGGEELEIAERDGRIELEPTATPMTLVGEGTEVASVPDDPLPPLTDATVRETLERTRR